MSEKNKSVLDTYPSYEVVIGIEVHVQLNTATKIFCSCPNQTAQQPNSNICQICTGHPGTLPVLNQTVAQNAILAGLATNCTIRPLTEFSRKHYFYPDLPKNYQITQGRTPICENGYVTIQTLDGNDKDIRLTRIHMEEDAGKNIHAHGSNESFVDLNRAGTPLLEIVSEPDISSAYEAKTYLKTLRTIVQYLGISTANMQDGAFRADTNISVRKKGDPKLGTKVELKNINSFKFIGDAIEYEIERQINRLEDKEVIRQETRLWDTKEGKTKSMRSKEEAADYRYFEDPDLPPLSISSERIAHVMQFMPELPHQKFKRYTQEHGLSSAEADIIVNELELARYYEEAYTLAGSKGVINIILRDLLSYMKENSLSFDKLLITPAKLATLVKLLEQGVINGNAAQEVFKIVAATGKEPADIVKEQGLEQIGSTEELEKIIEEIIQANPGQTAEYKAGKHKLFGFFIGQAMQKTKGKANPTMLNDILTKKLNS